MGLQVYGLLLRGRPQVRLLSGTCKKAQKAFVESCFCAFYFYIAIQPRAFATELTRMMAAKMGHR